MKIGCPKEIKNREYRVGLTPGAASAYVGAGHDVVIERGAGAGAGFTDEEYLAVGAKIRNTAKEIWDYAEMIVKVKEPLAAEYPLMKPGQILYTYLHLAADEALTRACVESGVTGIAYETVATPAGALPLLRPMSEVAGRMSAIMGTYFLSRTFGGRGLPAMGAPGVVPANVLILGGGTVGINAARVAAGLGTRTTVTDVNHDRLAYLSEVMPDNCVPVYSDPLTIADEIKVADIVIGAVQLPGGAKAPKLVTRELMRTMKPGAVFVDVAIDQGGVAESSRPTTHDDPVFVEEGVVHYCVANMPGAYPRTSTIALSNVTTAYGLQIANKGARCACSENPALMKGLNTCAGKLTIRAVAEACRMEDCYVEPECALSA